jgi:Putative Ig domain
MFNALASFRVGAIALAMSFFGGLLPTTAVAANTAPTIWGKPATAAYQNVRYDFRPGAADADGNALRFSIVNKPAWMWFDTYTGKLSGIPRDAQLNRTFSGITIRVTDGIATTALPAFAISVKASTTTTNRVPMISGTPVTSAIVGRPYAFKPTAADADGDPLTFSITGKPAWASFDTTNGTLYGTPTSAQVGTYWNIAIKVSDGKSSASLAPFSIKVTTAVTQSVTLNWSAPTQNTDGSALTDLAGYVVRYGQVSRQYTSTFKVWGAGAASAVVEGLGAGTWYFSVQSFNTSGLNSELSGEVSVRM